MSGQPQALLAGLSSGDSTDSQAVYLTRGNTVVTRVFTVFPLYATNDGSYAPLCGVAVEFFWRIKTQNSENRRKRGKPLENRRKIRREAFLAERRRR